MIHAEDASRGTDPAVSAAAGQASERARAQAVDQISQAVEKLDTGEVDDDNADDNESCGFCRFMKGGGCRAAFVVSEPFHARPHRMVVSHSINIQQTGCFASSSNMQAWSKCVDEEREAGADYTETCTQQTLALRECMLKHQDYYKVLLDEEEEMTKEKRAEASSSDE
jgi:hypothetical protein